MDTVFTGIATSNNTIGGAWPIIYDRQQLLSFPSGHSTSRPIQPTHPGQFYQPVASCIPLRIFHAFNMLEVGERFYWELPIDNEHSSGAGTATLSKHRQQSLHTASTAWRHLQKQTIVANTQEKFARKSARADALRGFCLDPTHPRTTLWNGFPDGLLIVPYLLFRAQGRRGATLPSINCYKKLMISTMRSRD